MTSGVEFRLSRVSAAKTAPVQNAPQPQNANLQTVAGSDASKPEILMKKLMPARSKVVQEKPVVSQVQSAKTPILGKMDAPASSSGQQGESFTSNPNGQGGNPEQNSSERQGFTPLPEVVPPSQSETIQQFNAAAGQGNVPNGQQAGVYGGVISQLTQQFWRLQQNSGTATTRLTLDLPDGEKLLVRFHVQANQGMQVQFSTKSQGLRNALEQSWEHLKVEAGQRGITLGDPEFEGIDVETTDAVYLETPARAVR